MNADHLAAVLWRVMFKRDGETLSDRELDDRDEWYGSPRELADLLLREPGRPGLAACEALRRDPIRSQWDIAWNAAIDAVLRLSPDTETP